MDFVGPQPTGKGPEDWFDGDDWFDVIHAGQEPSRIRATMVRFAPGARAAWHHPAVGQTLQVVAGIALIGTRDGVGTPHPAPAATAPDRHRSVLRHPRQGRRTAPLPPGTRKDHPPRAPTRGAACRLPHAEVTART